MPAAIEAVAATASAAAKSIAMATFGEPPLSDGTTPKDWPRRSLPDSLARGLAALLAIGCWLIASGKLTSFTSSHRW